MMDNIPFLSHLTEGALFIGFFCALFALTVFERKGKERRVPIWGGIAIGIAAMFLVPPLLNSLTGKYQDASLFTPVNQCTNGLVGTSSPYRITNICDYPIHVGLCRSNEENPNACRQSFKIAPRANKNLSAQDEQLASLPANPNGFTIIACKEQHRPSRDKKVGGRGYRGVCLPGS